MRDFEMDVAFGVAREHLDGLELAAELGQRVRHRPALNVVRPRDERLAVPKPTVSPYHCEIKLTCFWPMRTWRRMLSAVPESSCTWCGVTVTWMLRMPWAHQRMMPSG